MLRHPIVAFFCFAILSVALFAASGPLSFFCTGTAIEKTFAGSPHLSRPHPTFLSPPPSSTVSATICIAAHRTVDAPGRKRPRRRTAPSRELTSDSSHDRGRFLARSGAQGPRSGGCQEWKGPRQAAIEWLLKQGADKNMAEYRAEREVHHWPKLDFDGYAVQWERQAQGRDDRGMRPQVYGVEARPSEQLSLQCLRVLPYAQVLRAAALPPGSMTGQCWLKHQDDPNNPQVNMRGDYSEAYIKRHPGAPKAVEWSAGVVVRKGTKVDLSTWSSRANW